jgi:hypothetical protein
MSRDYQSVIFNAALHREVTFLSYDETVELIRAPVASIVEYDDLAVDRLWRATNGHPYFTQLLCVEIILEMNIRGETNYVTGSDVGQAIERVLERGGPVLQYLWDQSLPTERILLAAVSELVDLGHDRVTMSEVAARLHMANPSVVDLNVAMERLVRRRLLQSTRPSVGVSEPVFGYCFDLLRLWVFRYFPLDRLLPCWGAHLQ